MELNREQIISEIDEKIRYAKFINTNAVVLSSKAAQFCLEHAQFYEQKIKELTEEVESLKQCMEHEHASFMETFGELDDKCKRLTEENERLRAENDELCDDIACLEFDNENAERRTVRKMQTEIEARCRKGGIYPAFVKSTIDQIAKEMLEGEK